MRWCADRCGGAGGGAGAVTCAAWAPVADGSSSSATWALRSRLQVDRRAPAVAGEVLIPGTSGGVVLTPDSWFKEIGTGLSYILKSAQSISYN